jgi:hypothetical protein
MSTNVDLTPVQQNLLNHWRETESTYWEAFDAYKKALSSRNKARAACRALGINISHHLPADA